MDAAGVHLLDTPLATFDAEDFQLLISAGIALEHIVGPAIELLATDIFAEGDLYKGDLLEAVLKIEDSFWKIHPAGKDKLQQVIVTRFKEVDEVCKPDL